MTYIRFVPVGIRNSLFAVIASLVCLLLICGATGIAGETYRNDQYHFRVDLPDGWTTMPAETLAALNAKIIETRVQHVVGFMREGGGLPFVTIQVAPFMHQDVTYDEVQRAFADDIIAKEVTDISMAEMLRQTPPGGMTMCRATNRIVHHMEPAGNDKKGDIFRCGNIGRDAIVIVWSYASTDNSSEFMPALVKINDSFDFDSAEDRFREPFVSRAAIKEFEWIGTAVMIVAAGLGMLAGYRATKAKPKRSPNLPDFDDLQIG